MSDRFKTHQTRAEEEVVQPDHTTPCQFTQATRWYVTTIAAGLATFLISTVWWGTSTYNVQASRNNEQDVRIAAVESRQREDMKEIQVRLEFLSKGMERLTMQTLKGQP